jgi:hypothetical protein
MKRRGKGERYGHGSKPIGHYDSSENTTPGTFGKSMDRPFPSYTSNETGNGGQRLRNTRGKLEDNPGDRSKKFV